MDYKAKVDAAIAQRSALYAQRNAVINDSALTVADKRPRVEAFDKQIEALANEAEGYVQAMETDALNRRAAVLTAGRGEPRDEGSEWRGLLPSRSEWAAFRALNETVDAEGGYTVPKVTANKYIDMLRVRSRFMSIPGLNVLSMESKTLQIPQLTGSDGITGPTDEATVIADNDQTWGGGDLTAFGYKSLGRASNEILADSQLNLRNIVAGQLVDDIAARIDADAFGTTATNRVKGLFAAGQNTKTTLTETEVGWDNVISAVINLEAAGGNATAILLHPTQAEALYLAKENGTSGAYLAGSVLDPIAERAVGLPRLISNRMPARSVAVVDGTRLYVGNRSVVVNASEHVFFDSDQVAFRAVMRMAGVHVAEATSVQWVEAAAS